MCTLATSASPFSAQIRVLRPLELNSKISILRPQKPTDYTFHLPQCLEKFLKIEYIVAYSYILDFATTRKSILRHFATTRKVEGSRSDELNYFFPIYVILPAALGPGVYSASNRNE
jgi:hypothetical protein